MERVDPSRPTER